MRRDAQGCGIFAAIGWNCRLARLPRFEPGFGGGDLAFQAHLDPIEYLPQLRRPRRAVSPYLLKRRTNGTPGRYRLLRDDDVNGLEGGGDDAGACVISTFNSIAHGTS